MTMRYNPFYDAWIFVTGRTDEHAASGIGWLLTVLFIALVLASIWIARKSWQQEPAQRTTEHLATWLMRVMIGVMWFQGSIWKLPLPVSGGFRAAIAPIGDYAAFEVHRWIAKNIFLSILPVLGPLVYLTELSLAVSFILGVLVRPMGVVGALFATHLWLGLYRQPEEWPWLYVFLIFVQAFFVVADAGKSLGLDAMIARKPFGPFAGNGLLARILR
ncbi:MAG TPA: DoxX family protein [Xanthobacteraceae bacterium]|jgi:hypothetical protein